ncbi:hypothetical protein ONA91_25135 [Micromonospora sp. DR5-3]|uniref:hypothetical protein n=1 Tax=unclassified Micromonospora TaxID=2617518 RepID=UPI0011DBED66|nr:MULTISPECIES: hypothetical protein [unclassified Micromonospora]MCW3817742.1 hypothetical protein [Micromonospora sp. DR5-3]TYC16168.1 hypothetical protein FXF52_39465 [Micromonospora sp. MP36]
MNDLERRYRWLLHAYPAAYRQARGAEIIGTYLDLAEPDRHWPSPADVADLLAGGVRERLRAAGAADLIPGVRLAAILAFTTATALAGIWTVAEQVTEQSRWGVATFGPFATTGIIVWTAWLLTAVIHALAPAPWTAAAVGVALLLTTAVVPVADLARLPRPPLFVLLPQATLGLLALAIPASSARWQRLAPLAVALAAGVTTAQLVAQRGQPYRWGNWGIYLPEAGVALLLTAMVTAAALALHRDTRGLWALLVLLTPTGLLGLYPLTEITTELINADYANFRVIASTAATILTLTSATLVTAVATRRRPHPNAPASSTVPIRGTCPTCGR